MKRKASVLFYFIIFISFLSLIILKTNIELKKITSRYDCMLNITKNEILIKDSKKIIQKLIKQINKKYINYIKNNEIYIEKDNTLNIKIIIKDYNIAYLLNRQNINENLKEYLNYVLEKNNITVKKEIINKIYKIIYSNKINKTSFIKILKKEIKSNNKYILLKNINKYFSFDINKNYTKQYIKYISKEYLNYILKDISIIELTKKIKNNEFSKKEKEKLKKHNIILDKENRYLYTINIIIKLNNTIIENELIYNIRSYNFLEKYKYTKCRNN